jgi:benzodiazapine receptor
MLKKWLKILMSILLCYLAAGIGSYATSKGVSDWYTSINKPSFNPPNWIFGPVWSLLYTLMGISLGLFWHKSKSLLNQGGFWFTVQLLLNTSWSFFFFYFHNLGFAFLVIILLIIGIGLSIYYFYKQTKWAAYLLLPYLAWVSFASILNFAIWQLNS